MNVLMAILLAIFLGIMLVVGFLALRHRIMLKLGLRNIPRRPAQTVLIVVGSMLSAVIITASFATGDTISTSIRNASIEGLGTIDEILSPARGGDDFGPVYIETSRFHRLQQELASFDDVDGIAAYIAESAPALNLRASLSEGRTNIVAPDPATLDGFGQFIILSDQAYLIENLPSGSILVNEEANEDLDAQIGDSLRLFLEDSFVDLRVEGIVENGGLAGVDPTILMPLSAAQEIFDKPSQINAIAISNRGGNIEGAELSHDVTTKLRVLFADPQVVQDLKSLLNTSEVLSLIESHEHDLIVDHREELATLRQELVRPDITDELVRVLSDEDVRTEVLNALTAGNVPHIEEEADTLFRSLSEMNVLEIKRFLLELSDQAASGVTALFILLGLFSVGVGVLLVFLIFVMLAAARRTEMGMARAIGRATEPPGPDVYIRRHRLQPRLRRRRRHRRNRRRLPHSPRHQSDPRKYQRRLRILLHHRTPQRRSRLLPRHDHHLRHRRRLRLPRQPHEYRRSGARPPRNHHCKPRGDFHLPSHQHPQSPRPSHHVPHLRRQESHQQKVRRDPARLGFHRPLAPHPALDFGRSPRRSCDSPGPTSCAAGLPSSSA